MRVYVALLDGKCVRFSTSKDIWGGFTYPSEVLFEMTKLGIRQVRDSLTQSEILCDKFLSDFFENSLIPFTLRTTSNYFLLPYIDANTFFDLLFSEKYSSRSNSKFRMMEYVDLEILDSLFSDINWKNFYNDPIFIDNNRKFTREIELIRFVNLFVKIKDLRGNYVDYDIDQYYSPDLYELEIDPRFSTALRLNF